MIDKNNRIIIFLKKPIYCMAISLCVLQMVLTLIFIALVGLNYKGFGISASILISSIFLFIFISALFKLIAFFSTIKVPLLLVDDQGLTFNFPGVYKKRISWDDVASAELLYFFNRPVLGISMKPNGKLNSQKESFFARIQLILNRKVFGAEVIIPQLSKNIANPQLVLNELLPYVERHVR